jgi:hypothetical protein
MIPNYARPLAKPGQHRGYPWPAVAASASELPVHAQSPVDGGFEIEDCVNEHGGQLLMGGA